MKQQEDVETKKDMPNPKSNRSDVDHSTNKLKRAKRRTKKIFSLIKKNKSPKLKKKLLKRPSLLTSKDESGRTLFHHAIIYEDVSCLDFIYSLASNQNQDLPLLLNHQDIFGNTPLHYATSDELIHKILVDFPVDPHVLNIKGHPAIDPEKFEEIFAEIEYEEFLSDLRWQHEQEQNQQDDWEKKISEEFEMESGTFQQQWNDSWESREREPEEDWFDSIRRARSDKLRKEREDHVRAANQYRQRQKEKEEEVRAYTRLLEQEEEEHNTQRSKNSTFQRPQQPILRERMNRREKLSAFEERWKKLVDQKSKDTLLRFADVPWPDRLMPLHPQNGNSEEGDFDEELFMVADLIEPQAQKKVLKLAQLRWHPDKFEQCFGHMLHPDHKQKILIRVTAVSKFLNLLSSRLES
eukprot:TRINITY_DN7888_c0_g1_i1.p2 TRINITY_DN7888_c0_g1~~TRINITY_DN7888_c0_g1_i1.p2  ORF type:complete len:409 (-),score=104.34 TRINITY_DN7888_c0_g1_i1:1628-2854(-)